MMNYDFSSITSIIKAANFNKILSGTGKTINIVKQAIPIYKEIKPMITKKKNGLINNNNNIIDIKNINEKKVSINTRSINDTLTFFN
ncbi:MAG: hypothetical protein RSC57_02370 [Bacilli bacterium]